MRSSVLLAVVALAGCAVGVAHMVVHVPKLELQISRSPIARDSPTSLRIYHPQFWDVDGVTFRIIRSEGPKCDLKECVAVQLTATAPATATFKQERRYVAAPVFGIAFGPNEPEAHQRDLLVRDVGGDHIWWVRLRGHSAEIKVARVSRELKRISGILNGPEPDVRDPLWEPWYKALEEFSRTIEWKKSKVLRVAQARRSEDLDELVVAYVQGSDG